jgi:sodium transport system permease protein
MAKQFRTKTMSSQETPPTDFDSPNEDRAKNLALTPQHAALIFVMVIWLLLFLSPFFFSLDLVGIIIVQVICIAGPALFAHGITGNGFRGLSKRLSLSPPSPRQIGGAILLAFATFFTTLTVIVPLSLHLFGAESIADEFHHIQSVVDTSPLWMTLLALALFPAICEEILMRGTLLPAIRARYGSTIAVLITALLFGAMHLSLARFLPTTGIGIILAMAVIHSGNLGVGIIIHLCNNAIALLQDAGHLPGITKIVESYPPLIYLAVACLFFLGTAAIAPPETSKKIV